MKYKPSRTLLTFHIAGFQFAEGCKVLNELKPNVRLDLEKEENNPYDADAVAIYYKNTKLGYVPREDNFLLNQFLLFGHSDVFETVVLSADPTEKPWNQVYVAVKVVDKR